MAEKHSRELLNSFGTAEKIVIEGEGYKILVNELTGLGDLVLAGASIGLSEADARLLLASDEAGRPSLIRALAQQHQGRKSAPKQAVR